MPTDPTDPAATILPAPPSWACNACRRRCGRPIGRCPGCGRVAGSTPSALPPEKIPFQLPSAPPVSRFGGMFPGSMFGGRPGFGMGGGMGRPFDGTPMPRERSDPDMAPFDMAPGRPSVRLSPRFAMPLTGTKGCVTQTFGILGVRGSGKTHTAKVMIEDMVGGGAQVVIVDPLGAMHGLRTKRTSPPGTLDGLDLDVYGGDHGIPIEPSGGALLAHTVFGTEKAPNFRSCLIDLSAMRKDDSIGFVALFLAELYELAQKKWRRTPVQLVVDEVDLFAPHARASDGQKITGRTMEDIVRRGRLRGFGCCAITQRPQAVDKNVLTQVNTLVLCRLNSPQDRAAIEEWVKLQADDDAWYRLRDELPTLPVGTAWVWSPGWLGVMRRVQVRPCWTADSSATPVFGDGDDGGPGAEEATEDEPEDDEDGDDALDDLDDNDDHDDEVDDDEPSHDPDDPPPTLRSRTGPDTLPPTPSD